MVVKLANLVGLYSAMDSRMFQHLQNFKKLENNNFICNLVEIQRSRVVYDRVRKRKNYFEIPAFFRLNEEYQEREIQNQMKTKTKMFLFMFSFHVLYFPALDFPRSI